MFLINRKNWEKKNLLSSYKTIYLIFSTLYILLSSIFWIDYARNVLRWRFGTDWSLGSRRRLCATTYDTHTQTHAYTRFTSCNTNEPVTRALNRSHMHAFTSLFSLPVCLWVVDQSATVCEKKKNDTKIFSIFSCSLIT